MRNKGPRSLRPLRTLKKSGRFFKRPGFKLVSMSAMERAADEILCRKLGPAAIAAGCDDLAATGGRHARTETVAALADKLGGLIGALHLFQYRGVRPFLGLAVCDSQERWCFDATGVNRKSGILNVRGV